MSALACSCDEYNAPWPTELIRVQKLDPLKNMTQQNPQTRKVIYSTRDEREAGAVGVTLRLAGHDQIESVRVPVSRTFIRLAEPEPWSQ